MAGHPTGWQVSHGVSHGAESGITSPLIDVTVIQVAEHCRPTQKRSFWPLVALMWNDVVPAVHGPPPPVPDPPVPAPLLPVPPPAPVELDGDPPSAGPPVVVPPQPTRMKQKNARERMKTTP
jgi:hypothetical protein